MKKFLIATTALVATAGVAAAEVTLSGSSRFGLIYTENAADETVIHNRFTLNIDATAPTDSGAEFFSRVRVRGGSSAGTGGATAASGVSAPRVGVRSGGFTLAVGNILGAWESMPGLYDGNVGLTGLSWGSVLGNNASTGTFSWDSFSSAGGGANGVEVIYSAGGFGAHLSHSDVSNRTALHVSYAAGDFTFAIGAQESDTTGEDFVGATVSGSFGPADVGLAIGDIDGLDAIRLNGSFEVGSGTTITAYVTDLDGVADDAMGLGFTHSLGGATLAGGIENTTAGITTADFGVRFSF